MLGSRFSCAVTGLVALALGLGGHGAPARAEVVSRVVPVASGAEVVAVDPSTHRVYVGSGAGIAVMDGSTDAFLATIPTYAYQLALNPATGRLYVSGQSSYHVMGDLSVIDTARNAVIGKVPIQIPPAALAVNPATNRLYVGCGACDGITVVDAATNQVVAAVPGGGALTVNPSTNRVYVASVGNAVGVYDGATNALVATVPMRTGLLGIALDPTTNQVYGINGENNTLVVIDGASNAVTTTVTLPARPRAIAVNPTTHRVYVANDNGSVSTNSTVSVVDGQAGAIVATIPVEVEPSAVAVDPTLNRIYVANALSRSVSVIDDPAAPTVPTGPRDARYFPPTGFRVDSDAVWDYFVHRGGVATFGYPVSRTFLLQGHQVQFFQRRIVELDENGHPRLRNLLDAGLMPYKSFNQAQLPAFDSALVGTAPPATDAPATLAFVRAHAPDTFQGMPVNFGQTFANTVTPAVAFGPRGGDPNLLPGFNLEIWGIPTSAPMPDPNNHNFVYLRFQRGIMMYDASCTCTQGILLADYLKDILTGVNLPADLAGEAQDSPFYRQYDPGQPNWMHDPTRLPDTVLTMAFAPE